LTARSASSPRVAGSTRSPIRAPSECWYADVVADYSGRSANSALSPIVDTESVVGDVLDPVGSVGLPGSSIPVAHGTTFGGLWDVSPMLAARSGLSTGDSSMRDVATKVAAAAAAEDDV
jgi:hypothetical protein